MPSPFDQHRYQVRLEWGVEGLARLAPADVVVVVDVLGLSTRVTNELAAAAGDGIAAGAGAVAAEAGSPDGTASRPDAVASGSVGTASRPDGAASGSGAASDDGGTVSGCLGTASGSLGTASRPDGAASGSGTASDVDGTASDAGGAASDPDAASDDEATAVLRAAARVGAVVLLGCLRNASATARAVLDEQTRRAGRTSIAVVAVGQRDRDGAPRFAVEDLLGAGAVIDALTKLGIDHTSPEAAVAAEGFHGLRRATRHLLTASGSGQALLDGGARDVVLDAAAVDVVSVVPTLVDGVFIAA
ncbi:2-phosphosulfolactate phosphatase [Microbacterium sp. NPDC055910]|uniref:2-phosphosulfolactate phosphatase n=1 Tax=Microbacterium sp. NPDC055910 TaxID=3345659 RepID=UPI0035DB34F2